MTQAIGFAPVWRADARILILGSLPGTASLQAQQYYAHPRNQFWPLMQTLFGVAARADYPTRLAQLQASGVALWDLLERAVRPGSLDSAIVRDSMQINDLMTLISQSPALHTIGLNGQKAAQLFRQFLKQQPLPRPIRVLVLPSTSPAHASQTFAEKLTEWQSLCQ